MDNTSSTQNQRLTAKQKKANDKKWYKDQADLLDKYHISSLVTIPNGTDRISEYKRMKVNYDLFNNILNIADLSYVCKPLGGDVGELPAKMVNRDITSSKIKSLLGFEMKRPFSWKVITTNAEATTRKEQEEFKRIREFVVSEVMLPIRQNIAQQYQEQVQGQEISDQEKEQIAKKIEEETKVMTPEEVKRYMQREHQDPAEVLSGQLLEYLINKCSLKNKFNDAFKHMCVSGKEILYLGIFNDEPDIWVVNPMRFSCDMATDAQFIEDGEWAVCEYRMTPSQVIQRFGNELTNDEIDKIYENVSYVDSEILSNNMFQTENGGTYNDYLNDDNSNKVRVVHCVWKSLRKVQFLTYLDENNEKQVSVVDESYKFDEESGDILLEYEWIPEVYETWKIARDIYVRKNPIPGQFKDLDNLYYCKLPYYGALCDNMNSLPTSPVDRLKMYQYYYNIVMYRIERLLATDKGKKVLMNINAIPDSAGIDIEKWQYFFESTPFMWFDPNEEGTQYNDVNTMAKPIDLTLASDIEKYVNLAEYLKKQAGDAVGITEKVEGQIGPSEAVTNTRQSLIQSSHILEPYFNLHDNVKKNVLQGLIEIAKVAYSTNEPKKLSYILDDMSKHILDLDTDLLDNNTFGIFVSNQGKADEAKDLIKQLAHAALQTQKIELSDVITLMKEDSLIEAEETLKNSESKRREYEQEVLKMQQDGELKKEQMKEKFVRDQHKMKLEEIRVEQEERRKTELAKASLLGASFNPDLDKNNNNINDFVELSDKYKEEKIQLDREKFEHQKRVDNKRLEQQSKEKKKKLSKIKEKT